MPRFCARNFHTFLSFNPHFKKPCKLDGTPPCKSQSREGLQTAIELNTGHAPITATSLDYPAFPFQSQPQVTLCTLLSVTWICGLFSHVHPLHTVSHVQCQMCTCPDWREWLLNFLSCLLNWSLCLQPCSYNSPYLLPWGPTVPNCLESSLHSINICLPVMC